MLTTVVLTIFGPDRPGLVEKVAAQVAAHGGNWLESRLLHLGGYFAGIVRVEVEEAKREELLTGLREADSADLRIEIQDATTGGAAAGDVAAMVAAKLEIVGHDRPGIIRAISRALSARGVNVEELATERTSAPMSGEPIFQARATVTLPPGLEVATVRQDLERIAADLMVDVRFSN
jgi:glycine cleavage system regulatory protein